MNLAIRKLAMIEQDFIRREEEAKLQGYSGCPIDPIFKQKVSNIMEKVRLL